MPDNCDLILDNLRDCEKFTISGSGDIVAIIPFQVWEESTKVKDENRYESINLTKAALKYQGYDNSNVFQSTSEDGEFRQNHVHTAQIVPFDNSAQAWNDLNKMSRQKVVLIGYDKSTPTKYLVLGSKNGLKFTHESGTDSERGNVPLVTLTSDSENGLPDFLWVEETGEYDENATRALFDSLFDEPAP